MTALSKSDAKELARCEAIIARGLDTFYEVGTALTKIKQAELYKAEFSSFEEYVQDKWGMSRPRAYELISAVKVQDRLSAIADTPNLRNEAQARALDRAPEDRQCEVWEEANATGRPTAKVITAIVKRITATAGTGGSRGRRAYSGDSMRAYGGITADAPEIHTGRPLPVRTEDTREDDSPDAVEPATTDPVPLVQLDRPEPQNAVQLEGVRPVVMAQIVGNLLDSLEDQDFTAGSEWQRQSWNRRLRILMERTS